ncbi:hypothetical protein H5300_24140, partial [Vibrio sp. SG41-7]|uniref:IS66 family insertion sequence element accessory protein TnpA n=1 Tax=Vibrio sp. SG41-7 TaxID=2760973 RepID=UPI0016017299
MSTLQQHWQHHIDAWQQTQLSQAQYCRSHQLDQSQFSYWKHKVLGASNTSTFPPFTSTVTPSILENHIMGRGRNGSHLPPPAQIRTCATNASGSYLESYRQIAYQGMDAL